MPYNTRRKSLSLPSLGIHVPITHAARTAAHRTSSSQNGHGRNAHLSSRGASPTSSSASASASASASSSSASASTHRHPSPTTVREAPSGDTPRHSSKRVKRSHGSDASASTPPPSPKVLRHPSVEMDDDVDAPLVESEIDMEAVNDDIVEAVILQLLNTGNRPHLIKELSAILMEHLRSVQQSANPCAIISSRLATYMKRPCWSTSTPCPLAKELETIHPRRTYYFLTTCPHLPLPDASSPAFIVPRTSIITPPLSSAASASESAEEERRRELSPSPEVDLSSPEFDDVDDDIPMPGTPIGSSSLRFSNLSHTSYVSRNQRGASPPLEKDEREFTQTAEGLQKRKLAGHMLLPSSTLAAVLSTPPSSGALAFGLDDSRDDSSLMFSFGFEPRHLSLNSTNAFAATATASPAMQPTLSLGQKKEAESDGWAKLDSMLDWDRSPENVALEELDGLLDDF